MNLTAYPVQAMSFIAASLYLLIAHFNKQDLSWKFHTLPFPNWLQTWTVLNIPQKYYKL